MRIPTAGFIEDLVRRAGDTLLNHFKKDEQLLTMRASVKEAVTRYDKMVDDLIIQSIRESYPQHSILTEESGLLNGDPDWLWVVDSLDGTSGYASSNPLFSVCIAVMHQGEIVLGTVYAPAIDEFYFAERGGGACLNHKPIHVSEIPNLGQSYLFYCEGGEKDKSRTFDFLSEVYPKVMDIRKLGSAGLETAWVAAGKGEAYYTTKIEPWDVAPGVLLVQEAGGMVTDFKGNPWKLETSDLLFSNGKVHNAMLSLLEEPIPDDRRPL
ncbi:MAG: inositol monophosphatase family protein, partial [Chloroflexota bacterium]|nr:inositol monophosphatase family protein [Chloroflexota bacterium]